MNFLKKQLWLALLLSAYVWMLPASDAAAQGSWGGSFGGGSGGSFGSGGSWGGSGGLLGGRQPIRNLFARIGDRLSGLGSGGSTGFASGGSTGFGSGGSTGFGSSGSTGLGSGGGGFLRGGLLSRIFGGRSGFGSGGSSGFGGSTGYSWGGSSGGSTGGFVSTSNFCSTDFISTVAVAHEPGYVDSYAPIHSFAPVETGYSTMAPYSNFSMEQSFPVGDQGLDPNYPVYESYAGGNVIGGTSLQGAFGGAFTPTMTTPLVDDTFNGQLSPSAGSGRIEDGGSIDGMLEGAADAVEPYYDSSPVDSFLPNPGPSVDGTNLTAPMENADFVGTDRAVLRLRVPMQAKVYVNGRLTKTPGAVRSFESGNLVEGRVYKYKVKAVIEQNGKQLVRSKLISLKTGSVHETVLDFDAPATTVLALNVPENASVKLCGKETTLDGVKRRFATTRLVDGEVCEGYSIEVSYRVDGELVKQVRKIDLAAGDFRTLTFDGDVTEQVAQR